MKKITVIFAIIFSVCSCYAQIVTPFYPTTEVSGYNFGNELDVFNNEIVVSSLPSPLILPSPGKVYVFGYNNGVLEQENVFYPTDVQNNDGFGYSLSINNDFIAIGAPAQDSNLENTGATYLYKKANNQWQFLQKITASDAEAFDYFGSKVKIVNNLLFIAAAGDEPIGQSSTTNNGSVSVYAFNGNEWVFSEKITIDLSYGFGGKIEAENNKIIISSNGGSNTITGFSLHTYLINNTNVTFQNSIELGNLEESIADFSLSNNHLYVLSSPFSQYEVVSEYTEDLSGNWIIINSFETIQSDQIFSKIEVNNDNVYVGSTGYFLQFMRNFPVLHYKRNGANWDYQNSIYGSGPNMIDDYFGASIASSNNLLVVGAKTEGEISPLGKAYCMDVTLATNEFEKKSSSIYPNPTYNFITIKNNSLNSLEIIEVYSTTGNLLFTETNNLARLSLDKLSKGIYFLKLKYHNSLSETHKIIKN